MALYDGYEITDVLGGDRFAESTYYWRIGGYAVGGAAGSDSSPDIVQRVWDSGAGGRWCYYVKKWSDPAPLAAETTPNWTGSISLHQILKAT